MYEHLFILLKIAVDSKRQADKDAFIRALIEKLYWKIILLIVHYQAEAIDETLEAIGRKLTKIDVARIDGESEKEIMRFVLDWIENDLRN